MRLRAFLAGLVFCLPLPLAAETGGAAEPACAAGHALSYLCGAERPEDVIAIPGTRWLIASGFAQGAGLKLVDTAMPRAERWFTAAPEQIAPDTRRFADCPAPVDPVLFNARGLSLRQTGPEQFELLVVNHGGRESVEVFEVLAAPDRPHLSWRGCMAMPAGQVGNSVAQFADGTVMVTVLTRPGTTIGDFMQGKRTGAVWQWRPGDRAFSFLPGTDLPGNNGIETDPDQRRFHVVAFGWHAVVTFDRRDTRRPLARTEAPDFMPDNIHWTGDRLLLAGMRLDEPACGGLRKVENGVADPMLCHRGWVVGEMDTRARRIATFAYGTPEKHFNGLSAAAIAGGRLWLGSFQKDRIASVDLAQPACKAGPGNAESGVPC